tara:strand:+ start:71 stop:1351 length:1281 start_codon:yes stop_codon:yes gene_type:complete
MVVEASIPGFTEVGIVSGVMKLLPRTTWLPALLLSAASASAQDTPTADEDTAQGQHDHDHAHADASGLVALAESFTIGGVIDLVLQGIDDSPGPDGLEGDLRILEIFLNGRMSEAWTAHGVVSTEGETVEVEEAFVIGNIADRQHLTLGQFFADFGPQMRMHIHDIPYPERPGALREFLGEELPGVGLQWEAGFGAATTLSLAAFTDMDVGHGHSEGGAPGPETRFADRPKVNDLGFVGRITTASKLNGTDHLYWGASGRRLGNVMFVDDGNAVSTGSTSNTVLGIDARWDRESKDGSGWTFGGEWLWQEGDLAAEYDPMLTTLVVESGRRQGGYLWSERRFDEDFRLGAIFSSFEHAEMGRPNELETTVYSGIQIAKDLQVRVAVAYAGIEGEGDRARLLIQLRSFFGNAAHPGAPRYGGPSHRH